MMCILLWRLWQGVKDAIMEMQQSLRMEWLFAGGRDWISYYGHHFGQVLYPIIRDGYNGYG